MAFSYLLHTRKPKANYLETVEGVIETAIYCDEEMPDGNDDVHIETPKLSWIIT